MATSKAPAKKTSVAKKPTATKKSAPAKKPAAAKTVPKNPAAKKVAKPRNIGAEERYKMIEIAAYYIAERHHFKGNATDFWVTAEAEISKKIDK